MPHKPEIDLISFEDADLENWSWSDDPNIWNAWGVIHFEVLPLTIIMAATFREVYEARKLRTIFEHLEGRDAEAG